MTTQKKIIIGAIIVIVILFIWLWMKSRGKVVSPDETTQGGSGSGNGGATSPVKPGQVNMKTYNECGCSPALNKVTAARIQQETKYQQALYESLLKQTEAINKYFGGS